MIVTQSIPALMTFLFLAWVLGFGVGYQVAVVRNAMSAS